MHLSSTFVWATLFYVECAILILGLTGLSGPVGRRTYVSVVAVAVSGPLYWLATWPFGGNIAVDLLILPLPWLVITTAGFAKIAFERHGRRGAGLMGIATCLLTLCSGCLTHVFTEDEVRERLKGAGISWREPIRNECGSYVLDMGRNQVTDLRALKGLPLARLDLFETPVSDLSPLQGMPLRELFLNRTKVKNLGPLQGLPLEVLVITETPIEDISPLQGLSLKWLLFDPRQVSKGVDAIRNMKTLQTINGVPSRDFWLQYSNGRGGP